MSSTPVSATSVRSPPPDPAAAPAVPPASETPRRWHTARARAIKRRGRLQHQRGLADAGVAADQGHRPGDQSAAEHPIELRGAGRQPRLLDARLLRERGRGRRRGRAERAPGAPPGACSSATRVFHSPQAAHWPCHFGDEAPQFWQTKTSLDLAMRLPGSEFVSLALQFGLPDPLYCAGFVDGLCLLHAQIRADRGYCRFWPVGHRRVAPRAHQCGSLGLAARRRAPERRRRAVRVARWASPAPVAAPKPHRPIGTIPRRLLDNFEQRFAELKGRKPSTTVLGDLYALGTQLEQRGRTCRRPPCTATWHASTTPIGTSASDCGG